MNGTYNIFVIDDLYDHIYIDNLPEDTDIEKFLVDHGFKWIYWNYCDKKPTSFYYTYKDKQLLKSNG